MTEDIELAGGIIPTNDGFQIDFTHAENPAARVGIRGVFHLMREIWQFLEKPTTRDQAQRAVLTIGLVRLFLDYIDEIERCKGAFFAQSVLACSLVETLLMLVCVKERDRVTQSRQWRKFAKKQSNHGTRLHELLPWIDLHTLVDIGDELGWFKIEANQLKPFTQLDEWHLSTAHIEATPREIIGRLQHLRNGVHPGKALRENFRFDEQNNKDALWLAFVSLAGVLVYAQDSTELTMTLKVHPLIKKMMQNESEVHNSINAGLLLGVATVALPNEVE